MLNAKSEECPSDRSQLWGPIHPGTQHLDLGNPAASDGDSGVCSHPDLVKAKAPGTFYRGG
ncbi:MAG: hypothetical protein OHK005_12680 [Candidatus Methylacidiphilales bacterium]